MDYVNFKIPISVSVSLGNATVSYEYEVVDAGNEVWVRNTSKSSISNAEIKSYFRNKLNDEIDDILSKVEK